MLQGHPTIPAAVPTVLPTISEARTHDSLILEVAATIYPKRGLGLSLSAVAGKALYSPDRTSTRGRVQDNQRAGEAAGIGVLPVPAKTLPSLSSLGGGSRSSVVNRVMPQCLLER